MTLTVIILSVLLAISALGLYKCYYKIVYLQGIVLRMYNNVRTAIVEMRQIDQAGLFEGNDRVGHVFKGLLFAIHQLNQKQKLIKEKE